MNIQQINSYKNLAEAVLHTALVDVRLKFDPNARKRALRFLTHEETKPVRVVWLSWLGLDDVGFQALLRQKVFQGGENKLTAYLATSRQTLKSPVVKRRTQILPDGMYIHSPVQPLQRARKL
jgi:hypothetical protein